MNQILPSYFSFDEKKLEEFMSELGIISEAQRRIFSMLISSKSAYIDYSGFFSRAESTHGGIRNFEAELLSLMRKVKSRFCGMVLTSKLTDGTKKNYAIVLIEEKDPIFFYYLMIDLFDNFYTEDQISFLSLSALRNKGTDFPSSIVREISEESISDSFFSMNHQEKVIFLFESLGGFFPVPAIRLHVFLEFCVTRLKCTLQSSGVKDWLSRISSLSIRNVVQIIQEDDLPAIINLCLMILSNQEDFLSVAKITEEDDFFKAYQIVKAYFANQESEKKEKAELEQLFLKHVEEISKGLSDIVGVINPDELSKLVVEHSKEFVNPSDFKSKALAYLRTSGNSKYEVPILYEFGGSYIHRDFLYPYFKKEFLSSVEKVRDHLILLARNALEQSISTVFSSQISVEKEIANDLEEKAPLVYNMLTQPKLLTEYIFYYLREIQGVKNMEEIKAQVMLYAPLREFIFVPFIEIYDVSLEEIFEKAYSTLSIFKKFWFYLIGRYSSYLEKVVSLDAIRKEAKILSLEETGRNKTVSRVPGEPSKKSNGSTRRGGKSRSASDKKEYTKIERDQAWRDFSKQIKD